MFPATEDSSTRRVRQKVGAIYSVHSRGRTASSKRVASQVAFMGDSITDGNTSMNVFNQAGYSNVARLLCNGKFRPVYNVDRGNWTFATGGWTTVAMRNGSGYLANHIDQVCASTANVVVILAGTNDANQGVAEATTVANHQYFWSQIRAVGKTPVVMAITPVPSGISNAATVSSRIQSLNAALKAAALAAGVLFVDAHYNLMTIGNSPTAYAQDAYMTANYDLHPNAAGHAVMGRALANALKTRFTFNYNRYQTSTYITPNAVFNQLPTNGLGWYKFPSGDGTFTNESYQPATDGNGGWWKMTLNKNTSSGGFNLISFATGAPTQGTAYQLNFEIYIESGSVITNCQSYQQPGGGNGYVYDAGSAEAFSNADTPTINDAITYQSPMRIADGGVTNIYPSILITPTTATAVIWVRNIGIRVQAVPATYRDNDMISYCLYLRSPAPSPNINITAGQMNTIETFVQSRKAQGKWQFPLRRFVLPIWNNDAANAYCLKTRQGLTWTGSPTKGNGYVQGSGSTSVYLRDNTTLGNLGCTANSMMIGALVVQAPTVSNDWMGVRDGITDTMISSGTTTIAASLGLNGAFNGSYASSEQTGIFIANRTSANDVSMRRRRGGGVTSIASSNSSATAGAPPSGANANMAYMIRWNSAINTPQTGGDAQFGAFFVGEGMNDTDADAFTLDVKNLWEGCTGQSIAA